MKFTLPGRRMRLKSKEAHWRTPVPKHWLRPGRLAVAFPTRVICWQVYNSYEIAHDSPLMVRLSELRSRLDERWPDAAALLVKSRFKEREVLYLILEPAARWMVMLRDAFIHHFAARDQPGMDSYTRERVRSTMEQVVREWQLIYPESAPMELP